MSIHVDGDHVAELVERLGHARTATMNFLVFCDDPGHREWVVERAERLAAKHPCRLILLDATGTSEGITATLASRDAQGGAVVSERIVAGIAHASPAQLASIVAELSVPGIATVLWWNGVQLLESETFARVVDLARDVIVDSSGLECGACRIKELGEFLARYPHVVLHDLAFLRLGPWMDMIAQFFDDEALREELFSIRSLRIESGSEAEAHYLAGWLGSRLSWEPIDARTFRARTGKNVHVEHAVKGTQRRVLRVVLQSDGTTYTAALSDLDPNTVCLEVSGAKARRTRCAPLMNVDNASLIERALLKSDHDQIFETSLLTVRQLLG